MDRQIKFKKKLDNAHTAKENTVSTNLGWLSTPALKKASIYMKSNNRTHKKAGLPVTP